MPRRVIAELFGFAVGAGENEEAFFLVVLER
jgi:hypothetical protein